MLHNAPNKTTIRIHSFAQSIAQSIADLLVFADGSPAADNALAYAEALVPDGHIAALLFGHLPDYPVNEFGAEAWLIALGEARKAAAAAEAGFRERLLREGSRAEVRCVEVSPGEEGRAIATQARYVDATVIGWPTAAEGRPLREFEAVLFNSGRPVILVPEACTLRGAPRALVVGWSPTREASRAIHDAMPMMAKAEHVSVVIVADDGVSSEQNPGDDIARHLARHDVDVEVKHVPAGGKPVAEVLLDQARFEGAELIVMGGYSHSRTGEWLFGGVTREMLGALTVPLMMSH